MKNLFRILPGKLTLPLLRQARDGHYRFELDATAWSEINAGAETVARIVARG